MHTPAPWTIEEYGDDELPALVIHRGDTENRICFMATPGSHGDPAVIEADARLIAAAPELLQELRTSGCPAGGWSGMPDKLIENGGATVQDCLDAGVCGCSAGAAVKKAEGK